MHVSHENGGLSHSNKNFKLIYYTPTTYCVCLSIRCAGVERQAYKPCSTCMLMVNKYMLLQLLERRCWFIRPTPRVFITVDWSLLGKPRVKMAHPPK